MVGRDRLVMGDRRRCSAKTVNSSCARALFPGHPNLLEASRHSLSGDIAKKPLLAREGANVTLMRGSGVLAQRGGDYGDAGFVYQRLFDLPGDGDRRPVIGSWVVDGEPAGMGIREDGPITGNTARFVPHVIDG